MAGSPLAAAAGLATFSPWARLGEASRSAPTEPGVYLARSGPDGPLVYVGHAGERAASRPPGLRGRLSRYASGKAAVSGLGEVVLDRALADPGFLGERLKLAEQGQAGRTTDWARAALAWADVHVAWAVTAEKASAKALEEQLLTRLAQHPLWNRQRPLARG